MFPPEPFDCLEGLDAFIRFFKTTREGKTYGVLFIQRGSGNEWYKILGKSDTSHETKRNRRHFQCRRLFPTVVAVRAPSAAVDKVMEYAAF